MADPTSTLKMFGKTLRSYREASGMSQETLADECNLHRTYISQLERGLKNPTLTTLLSLSNALGVPASTLMETVSKETL